MSITPGKKFLVIPSDTYYDDKTQGKELST